MIQNGTYLNVIDNISIKYEDVFPDYFDKLKIQITEINNIYQTHFKDISELNYFIYPDNQVKFKKYEKNLENYLTYLQKEKKIKIS